MTQVNHSPGVPNSASLATVVASSATPILVGPSTLTGQPTITTLAEFTTETTNIWSDVLIAQATTVAYHSSTPIILGPAIFSGAPWNVGVS
jgi:hypothetical protein